MDKKEYYVVYPPELRALLRRQGMSFNADTSCAAAVIKGPLHLEIDKRKEEEQKAERLRKYGRIGW